MLDQAPPCPDTPADEELVARILRGDRAAESVLVARYARGLMAVIRRVAPEQAEDIRQETFGAVIARLRERGLDDPAKLGHFLLRTARNLALRARRDAARRPVVGLDDYVERTAEPAPGPYQQLTRQELARCVRQVIRELGTPRDREILYRFYIAEIDKQQICRELDLDPLHFNRVLFRARERFRTLLLARQLYDAKDDHESR